MVDSQSRARLHTSLAQLVDGQLTTNEFNVVYCELMNSTDLGVAEITRFGWGLYSDDWSYRLTGEHAIDETSRRMAERCFVFLGTELEYRWPKFPDDTLRSFLINILGGIVAVPGYLLGLMALILACVQASYVGWTAFWILFLVGLLLLSWGVAITWFAWRYARRKRDKDWKDFYRGGDWEVWPFLSREEIGGMDAAGSFLGHPIVRRL
jgi:hypothetical protein